MVDVLPGAIAAEVSCHNAFSLAVWTHCLGVHLADPWAVTLNESGTGGSNIHDMPRQLNLKVRVFTRKQFGYHPKSYQHVQTLYPGRTGNSLAS